MQQENKTYGQQLSPEFLAKYEITGLLGEGGMGQVLRGRQKGLGRDVAIKLLTMRSYATPERRERFRHEAQRCANMNHPNLVGVYDYGEDGERPYMVMELVDGESIAERLKREGRFSIRETLKIGIDICEGLQYAHDLGLVHRDIKSDNVLLDKKEKQVKVADFGIAIEADEGEEKNNVIIGTPSYMSPEQASGKKADHRSDIYSTGIILYEMLTGKVPFTGETSMAIIIKHLNEQAGGMRDMNPEVPPQLEDIVQRALEKSPDHRYQTCRDLASQLKKATSLLASWQATAKEGPRPGSGSMSLSRPGALSISTVVPESEEEKLRRYAAYGLAGVVALVALLALIYIFFLAPPTYQALEIKEELGFTQAQVDFRSKHPYRTKVEYKEQGGSEVQVFVGENESVKHRVFLEGLKEDTTYSWRPLFPAGQVGEWQSFLTRRIRFSDIKMTPRVNGAKISWKTSLAVEMEIEYLLGGKVQEIIHLEGTRTEHSFTAAFPDPSHPYQVRLKAVLGGRFQATFQLDDIPTINLPQITRLVESIHKTVGEDQFAYPDDLLERYESQSIRSQLKQFRGIRELFFKDDQVPSEARLQLVEALNRLLEFDVFLNYQGGGSVPEFSTGALNAFGKGFRASRKAPFRAGKEVLLLGKTHVMVFDGDPPGVPIEGGLPRDAKDAKKFSFSKPEELRNYKRARDVYLELRCKDVAPYCYFQVEIGRGKNLGGVLTFFPDFSDVREKKSWGGVFRARVDPRILQKGKLRGWVRLRFLRNSVNSQEDLDKVRGTFQGLKLFYRN
jgi:serine/threonine protein kinase